MGQYVVGVRSLATSRPVRLILIHLSKQNIWRAFGYSCLVDMHLVKFQSGRSTSLDNRMYIRRCRQSESMLMRFLQMRPLSLRLPLWLSSRSRQIHNSPQNSAIPIAQLLARAPDQSANPDTIEVNGRVRSVRRQKTRAFASIGDGTSLEPLQAVLTPEQAEK